MKIKCPLCGEDIIHKHQGESDIWACKHCPFVGFEYYGNTNLIDLEQYINRNY